MKVLKFLVLTLILILLIVGFAFASSFETFMVGNIKVVSLQDMPMKMDCSLLRNASEKSLNEFLNPSGKCDASLNVFLVDNGKEVVLIDTGLGIANGGKMLEVLKAAGYSADKITKIAITHLHGDHFGGLFDEKMQPVFKNAKVFIGKKELDFWLDKTNNLTAIDASVRGTFDGVAMLTKVYSGKIVPIVDDVEIIKGVKSDEAYGHTAGHLVYKVEGNDKSKMVVWGDIIHCLEVQINDPEVTLIYDYRPILASETRKEMMEDVAEDKITVAGAHLPYSGFITIKRDMNKKYSYSPAK